MRSVCRGLHMQPNLISNLLPLCRDAPFMLHLCAHDARVALPSSALSLWSLPRVRSKRILKLQPTQHSRHLQIRANSGTTAIKRRRTIVATAVCPLFPLARQLVAVLRCARKTSVQSARHKNVIRLVRFPNQVQACKRRSRGEILFLTPRPM